MNRMKAWTGASLAIALAQNVCTAILIVGGVQLAAGIPASAADVAPPVRWFHQDIIRIPMLLLASIGAIADLVVLSWVKRLHRQPGAKRPPGAQNAASRHSQRLQYAMAVATLVLVGAESGAHAVIVHRAQAVIRRASISRK